MKTQLKSIVVTLVAICGCAKGNDELSNRVYLHCSGFAQDVDQLAERYQSRLAFPASTDQERAAADLKFQIKGREGRGERSLAMVTEFLFCSGLKDDTQHRVDPLRRRFSHAADSYVRADDPTEAAKLVAEMAAVVHELDKLN